MTVDVKDAAGYDGRTAPMSFKVIMASPAIIISTTSDNGQSSKSITTRRIWPSTYGTASSS